MNEKEILSQLNKLKDIKPDQNWKEKNRELLCSQIYSSENSEHRIEFSLPTAIGRMLPAQILRSITQPVMAIILIVAFLLGGGILSLNASRNSKPGDSLYIAKIINEKAQIALTFDEKKKAQLGMKFASNRAEELNQVLAENNDNEKKNEKVEKLVNNFKKEISGVKTRLEKIAKEEGVEEDGLVFSANMGKDENGVQVSGLDDEEIVIEEDSEEVASSTLEIPEQEKAVGDPMMILVDANNLFDKKDYNGTLSKLEDAGEAMSQINIEEEKGQEEIEQQATSTEENISSEDTGEVLGVEENIVEEDLATSTEEK